MIETDYHILTNEMYQELMKDALIEGVSIDYYLMEFCDIEEDE